MWVFRKRGIFHWISWNKYLSVIKTLIYCWFIKRIVLSRLRKGYGYFVLKRNFMLDNISTLFWFLNFMNLDVTLINSWRIVICFCLNRICYRNIIILLNFSFWFFMCWLRRIIFRLIFLFHSKHFLKEIKCSFEEFINFS